MHNSSDCGLYKGSFTLINRKCEYPGGKEALVHFISHQIKYPEQAFIKGEKGKVVVRFVVDQKGKVSHTFVVRSTSTYLAEAVKQVVHKLDDFRPEIKNGIRVKTSYILPVTFRI